MAVLVALGAMSMGWMPLVAGLVAVEKLLHWERVAPHPDRYVEPDLADHDADARVPGTRAHLEGCPACHEDTTASPQGAVTRTLCSRSGERVVMRRTSDAEMGEASRSGAKGGGVQSLQATPSR